MLALLLPLCALAQDAVSPEDPLPIAGTAWPAVVTAYALPTHKLAYLTDDAPLRTCAVLVKLGQFGAMSVEAGECPAPMADDAVSITRAWRFAPVEPDPPSGNELVVTYVLQYSEKLGVTTLHAEIDPGADHAWERGAPGVKLVHRAGPARPLDVKLSGKLRKAGAAPGSCRLRVEVAETGAVMSAEPVECPAPLAADAAERVKKARFDPKTVDGTPMADRVEVEVRYTL